MAEEQRTEQDMGEVEDLEAPETESEDVRGGADEQTGKGTLQVPGQQAGSLGLPTA